MNRAEPISHSMFPKFLSLFRVHCTKKPNYVLHVNCIVSTFQESFRCWQNFSIFVSCRLGWNERISNPTEDQVRLKGHVRKVMSQTWIVLFSNSQLLIFSLVLFCCCLGWMILWHKFRLSKVRLIVRVWGAKIWAKVEDPYRVV